MPNLFKWTHPRVLSALLAVFLAGAATGALGMKLVNRGVFASGPKSMKQMERAELLHYFQSELGLSEKQNQQVESLLDDHFKYMQSIGAQLDEVRLSGRESIAKVLTPEQRKKYDRLMAEWQRSQR